MTLQERILEVLGEKALQGRMLYGALKGEQPAAVDIALNSLMRSGAVTLELGHYQRGKGKPLAPPKALITISQAVVVSIDSRRSPPPAAVVPMPDRNSLTKRERQIFELVESGVSQKEIMTRLSLSKTCISSHLSNARGKLGISIRLVAPVRPKPTRAAPKSAPPAAGVLSAAPSKEGVDPATVGADPPRKRITFSHDLIVRLVERQRSLAMTVQMLCDRLSMARQDLADIEELVRIATTKEPG